MAVYPAAEGRRAVEDPEPRRREARGRVTINRDECKGCGLCIAACPPECLELEADLSAYGVHPAHYTGTGCTGCGICFYTCPEPGAITVYRLVPSKTLSPAEGPQKTSRPTPGVQEENLAGAL